MNAVNLSGTSTQLIALEFVMSLLESTSPRVLGKKLTDHLRELSGAKTVMVLLHRHGDAVDDILYVSPQSNINLLSPDNLRQFCFEKTPETLPCIAADLPACHSLKEVLETAGIKTLSRFALRVGGELVGQLLLLNLPGAGLSADQTYLLTLICPSVALALKNALLFAHVERHTRDLELRAKEQATELDRTSAFLLQSENRLRSIIRTSTDGFCIVDLSGRFLEVNEAYCRMTGYDAHELYSMTIRDLETGESMDAIDARLRRIVERGYCRFDSRHRRREGALIDVDITAQYYDIDGGQIVAFLRDITDRKRVESYRAMGQEILLILSQGEDLAEAMRRIIDLVRCSTGVDAVGIRLQQDDDYPYFYQQGFSQEFLSRENSLLARSRDGGICMDADGSPSLECTCGMVICGKIDPASHQCTKGGSIWTNNSFDVLKLPPSEDPRSNPRDECVHQGYASVALVPIRAKGRVNGLLQLNAYRKGCFSPEAIEALERIAENIGEAMLRRQTEEEKRKLEAHFQQAQKMESVGRLAGGVAHDFNNMLTVILGWGQMMLMGMDPDDRHHSGLQEICLAAQRSAELTKKLLAFARRQTIEPRALNLNDIVESMLKMLNRLIGEDIQLVWHPADELWQVKVDSSQIDQIIANLCVNARDAIADVGKITIETGNRVFDREFCLANPGFTPGDYVVLAVSDTGCGMSEDTRAKIFEPFFTTKVVGKGTGLGLASVYGIVKQNKGFIKVYSELGYGTTFRIYLPRYRGKDAGVAAEAVEQVVRGGRETILLVEDETAILNLIADFLRRQEYAVFAAGTPSEAIGLAQEHSGHIDLLMTDTVMPEMNGKQLAAQIASLCPQIKCLYMSGYTENVVAHHGVLDEGVNFISKPFQLPDLASKIRRVLEG